MNPTNHHSLHATPFDTDQPRWHWLLQALDPHSLTETFLQRVVHIDGYDPSPVPIAEIRRTGRLTFHALLEGLASGGLPEFIPVAHEIGVSRARSGVPIASLTTAIHQDSAVLWEALTNVAIPEDAELIVRHTGIVLTTVEAFASQTQAAYAAEAQRMQEAEASARRGFISTLFQEPPPSPEQLSRIATGLGLPEHAELCVVAATGDDIPALRGIVTELERSGVHIDSHHLGGALVTFRLSASRHSAQTTHLISTLEDLRVGIALASGMSDLRRAATVACELSRLLLPEEVGAMTWGRGWARLAATHLLASGSPILADVHSALAACGPTERLRLEEAAQSYLRTGSITHSAAELFCHRNTLTNRLRRFTEITGVDPTVPNQAARLVVGWA